MKIKNRTLFIIFTLFACNFIFEAQHVRAQIGPPRHQDRSFFLENQSTYKKFIAQLKTAIRGNDREAVAEIIEYPFRTIINEKRVVIRKKEQLIRDYDLIFTRKVKNSILIQPDEILFSSPQGIMIGEGVIWIGRSEKIEGIKILSINN